MPNRFASQTRSAVFHWMRQFGEDIVYHPRDGSAARPIQGKVDRNTLEIVQETGDIASQALIVTVINDPVKGITSEEVDTGGDEVTVSLRVGLTGQRRSIARILSDSGSKLRMLIQ